MEAAQNRCRAAKRDGFAEFEHPNPPDSDRLAKLPCTLDRSTQAKRQRNMLQAYDHHIGNAIRGHSPQPRTLTGGAHNPSSTMRGGASPAPTLPSEVKGGSVKASGIARLFQAVKSSKALHSWTPSQRAKWRKSHAEATAQTPTGANQGVAGANAVTGDGKREGMAPDA